jgi:hypothetical protein
MLVESKKRRYTKYVNFIIYLFEDVAEEVPVDTFTLKKTIMTRTLTEMPGKRREKKPESCHQ